MSKAKIQVVNQDDEFIECKERGTLTHDDIYRVSGLWLTNGKGEVLIAQRKWDKKNDPGKWGPAAAGTIDEGETYDSNIVKEAEEEINLIGVNFISGPKQFIDDGQHKFFCQWFAANSDKSEQDFSIQDDEVEQVKWVAGNWLKSDILANPNNYVPNATSWVGLLLK